MKRIKRFKRWLGRTIQNRPFFSVLVVLLIVITPGYLRLEKAVDTANKTADKVAVVSAAEERQNEANLLDNCQTRNTAASRSRNRFTLFFSAIEAVFTSAPEQTPEQRQRAVEFVARLRVAVPLDPSIEDVDCDGNGVLGPEDYAKGR